MADGKLNELFYDKDGEPYFKVVLLENNDRLNINGRSYLLNQARIAETTFFTEKRYKVERSHPIIPKGATDKELIESCYRPRPHMDIGKLQDIEVDKAFNVVAKLYGIEKGGIELRTLADHGWELGVRAIVSNDSVSDIICWDLVHVNDLHLTDRMLNAKTPPLNTTVLVSANNRSTWFPAQFLWIGNSSFVWRNMMPGALSENEIPERAHHSYFDWVELGDLEPRSYHPHQESEELQAYFGYKRKS